MMEPRPELYLFSAIAVFLTLWGYALYIWGIWKGTLKPHFFSWLIWGLTTCIVFLAQYLEDGGLGSYPTGVSGLLTLVAAGLCFRHRKETHTKPIDWILLFFTLLSVPLWFALSDPWYSVLLLTGMDVAGFIPSFRKAITKPEEESISFYFLFCVRNGISIPALEVQNPTTIVFPLVIGIFCLLFVLWVQYFRWRKRIPNRS